MPQQYRSGCASPRFPIRKAAAAIYWSTYSFELSTRLEPRSLALWSLGVPLVSMILNNHLPSIFLLLYSCYSSLDIFLCNVSSPCDCESEYPSSDDYVDKHRFILFYFIKLVCFAPDLIHICLRIHLYLLVRGFEKRFPRAPDLVLEFCS